MVPVEQGALKHLQGVGELSPNGHLSWPQVELEEAVVRRQAAVRTLGQQARVWSGRILLNLLVIALLGAAFYGVYWATGAAVELQVWRVLGEGTPLTPAPFQGWRGLKSIIPGHLGGKGAYV